MKPRLSGWSVLRAALVGGFVLTTAAVMPTPASGQGAAALSTIHGVVSDDTGGALPGVAVSLSSPALQTKERVLVTEADGTYRFADLPAGTYRLSFQLTGFRPFIRDELRLTIGFTARVDVTMAVGAVEESVTVSGQSPVIDLSSTSTVANFTEEVLDGVPRSRDIWAVLDMAPGVIRAGAPDVGGSRIATDPAISTYGVTAQPKIEIEGINVTTGPQAGSSVYFNYFGFEEIQFKTSGTDAEVGVPGIQMIAVLRSGGNDFHGRYEGSYQGPKLQGSNLTPALRAQGLSNTEPLKYHYDAAGDLGGRIIRDQLWFYGGFSRQHRISNPLGFVQDPGPDGVYLSGDEPLADFDASITQFNVKMSWQLSKNNRLIGVYQKGTKLQSDHGAGRFRPAESTRDYYDPTWVKKGELQSTLNAQTLVNIVGGFGGYYADYSAMRNPLYRENQPSRLDRETGLRTGGHEASDQRPRGKWQVDGGISFFPDKSVGGRHELKTGVTIYWNDYATGFLNHPHGNYVLIHDRVGGVANTPVEIEINNSPLTPKNGQTTYAWYLKDTWRIGDRLTANLGVRYERMVSFLPAQSKEASPQFPTLFPAGSFAERHILTWNRVLPRVGLAWNLNPKTVLKTTFGEYNYLLGDDFAEMYNVNARATTRYRWRDLDRNGNYTPGEVDLNVNGPDFLAISGGRNSIVNPDLKQPMTTEVTVSLERELRPNLGFRTAYIYRHLQDFFSTGGQNVLRPREVYNIPLSRRDPGPDGVLGNSDDGGRVTIYDYDAAYRGADFVGEQVVNSPEVDTYHTIELALTKRATGRWMASASFFAVKNHQWLTRVFDSPNADYFPVDDTWGWAGNATASYRLPWDIQFAGFLQTKQGVKGQRTNIFRAADPDGGTPLRQLSTVTLRLEPFGAQRGSAITLVNLRAAKDFSLPRGRRVGFDIDLYNLLNTSAPTTMTFASGPTFGYVTGVMAARIVRFGARFSF